MDKKSNIIIGSIGSIIALLYFSPFYILLVNAFKTKKELLVNTLHFPKEITFSNFQAAIDKMNFFVVFKNSVLITAGSIILLIVLSSMGAWVLVRDKSKKSKIIFFFFISSMLIPFQSVMLPLVELMGKMKLLNKIPGIIFMYIGFGCSMSLFLFHGFIKSSVPTALEEAATIDGCKRPEIFFRIVFPLLKPISVTVAILNVIWIWNDYLLPSLVLQKKVFRTIPLATSYFFGQYSSQWNLAMASLTLSILPVVLFYIFMQKSILKGVMAGAVKG